MIYSGVYKRSRRFSRLFWGALKNAANT
ncbi:hypothetical protein Gotur_000110, partial [Gossypium turneri]